MKPFRFQKFEILQNSNVFRVGTDGVLLGAFSEVSKAKKILEVGTGNGLIALMLAQRNLSAEIIALDINEEAIKLAEQNFKNSCFSERLIVKHEDFKKYYSRQKFDLIVSNPPYFDENTSEKDRVARQKVELNFENLISKSSEMLSDIGILSVIIPSEAAMHFEIICEKFNLFLKRKINIFGIRGGSLKRNILEFSFLQEKPIQENFTIEKSPRIYSEQYLKLTKDFHVFEK